MKYSVDMRERDTGDTVKTILETENMEIAHSLLREYEERHGIFNEIERNFPQDKYFMEVYQVEN